MSELEELQEAKLELNRCNKILRTLRASPLSDSEEVLKAELGVAKAKLGVAEAKLGVAEAKEESQERLSEIAKAEMGVAKAEWDVAIAVYNFEAKTSNTGRLEFLQGQIEGRKETYKTLEGQLSSPDFHAPPGSNRTS